MAEVVAADPWFLSLLRQRKHEEARRYWLSELQGMTYLEHARHLIATGVIGPAITEEMLAMPIDADLARRPRGSERHARRQQAQDKGKRRA